MSLILAFRADRKVYFMADRRILSGYTIERDQPKMVILGSRENGNAADIVLGVCGEVRMMTILNDPRTQAKLLQAYNETPTIYGLVDAIKEAFVSNGISQVLSILVAVKAGKPIPEVSEMPEFPSRSTTFYMTKP